MVDNEARIALSTVFRYEWAIDRFVSRGYSPDAVECRRGRHA